MVNLYSYDLSTNSIITYTNFLQTGILSFEPVLSFDRKTFALPYDRQVYIIGTNPQSHYSISPQNVRPTWLLSWSPVEPKLVLGGTDIDTEIGFCTNYLYIYDRDQNSTNLLSKSSKNECFDDPGIFPKVIWSPDGKKIAAMGYDQLCIIDITNNDKKCTKVIDRSKELIGRYVWSPQGKYIAFIVGTKNDLEIRFFDVNKRRTVDVLGGIGFADSLSWESDE